MESLVQFESEKVTSKGKLPQVDSPTCETGEQPLRKPRKQVARMGIDVVTAEEWYMKYGDESHISREEMFCWFFW